MYLGWWMAGRTYLNRDHRDLDELVQNIHVFGSVPVLKLGLLVGNEGLSWFYIFKLCGSRLFFSPSISPNVSLISLSLIRESNFSDLRNLGVLPQFLHTVQVLR